MALQHRGNRLQRQKVSIFCIKNNALKSKKQQNDALILSFKWLWQSLALSGIDGEKRKQIDEIERFQIITSQKRVTRRKEHIKNNKKFLLFLINKLCFVFLSKIRNNDRTIKYIIQTADIHLR